MLEALRAGLPATQINFFKLNLNPYSYLNASIGCMLEALRAGYQPNRIPIPALTANANRIESGDT